MMGKTMDKVMCVWVVLFAAGCGQGSDALDPAEELDSNEQALAAPAPSATGGALLAPAPQVTEQIPFCSNAALPSHDQVQQLVQQGPSFPEPDPFYRAPQDKDAWRRATGASTSAPTLAPENVDESRPGSTD